MTRGNPVRNAQSAVAQKSPTANPARDPLHRPPGFVWVALACAAIILAGLAAYSDSFRGVFLFDDIKVMEEPTAQQLWPLWRTITGVRPVAQFTLALNHLIGDLWAYHAFNLAIHILAALTLFGVVRRTLMLPPPKSQCGTQAEGSVAVHSALCTPHSALVLALVVALLWMLHPLQTESVTYVIQRMESLMGQFYLLTLYCFIRAAAPADRQDTKANWKSQIANRKSQIGPSSARWYAASVLACALGMGSKEVMVSAPLLVLLYDRTFIAGSFREALRRRWGFYLALAVTWVILTGQMIEAFAPRGKSAGFGIPGITAFQYARSEPGVILHYLALAFWPAGLCLDYAWPVANGVEQIAPGAIVIGALLAATVWALVRKPKWGFLGAWFFLVLAPTSSLMPVKDLAVEHRMYLPLAAVVAAMVLAAYLAVQNLPAGLPALRVAGRLAGHLRRGPPVILALTVAAAFGCLTFLRNQDYRSAVTIWQDATNKRHEDPRAWNNLGQACDPEGGLDKAIPCFDRAIALDPDYSNAYYNRGTIHLNFNRYAEAIGDFDKAIALEPGFAIAWHNRGMAYEHLGRKEDLPLALRDYNQAILLKPDYADAYNNRAAVYFRMGRYDFAIRDYDSAIKLKPDFVLAWSNRAVAHFQMKEYDKARADMEACEKLHGNVAPEFRKAVMQATMRTE